MVYEVEVFFLEDVMFMVDGLYDCVVVFFDDWCFGVFE